MTRRATFHRLAVHEGDAVNLQPGETVLSAEYEAEGDWFYVVVMCALEVGQDDETVPG